MRAVSGDAALTVVGTGPSFPEEIYPTVLAEPGVAAAVPLTRTEAAVEGGPPLFLEVLGVDLLAPVRLPWQGDRAAVAGALVSPAWLAVTPQLAAERGWKVGDEIRVSAGSRRATLRIGALVDFRKVSPLASQRLGVMDVAEAQALLGPAGRLHQIDVFLVPGADAAEVAARLAARLGPVARVTTPEQRVAEASGLLAAFRMNLTALSLISLFVGGFLVYGSTQAAIVRRREEIGVLRCLGATRGQVLRLLLARGPGARHRRHGAGNPARLARRPARAPQRLGHRAEPLPARGHRPRRPHPRAAPARRGARRGRLARRARSSRRSTCPVATRVRSSPRSPWRNGPPARPGRSSSRRSWLLRSPPGLRRARPGAPVGGLPGGARRAGRASARRSARRPPARERGPAEAALLRIRRPHARPSPSVIGGGGGRAGGVGRHAHRDHRHGHELPRHRDRMARRHPARRPLRHHAHLEPRPRRGHALSRGPRPARPGSRGGPDGPPAPDLRAHRRAARAGGGRRRRPARRRLSRQRHRRRRRGGFPAGPRRGGPRERAAGPAGAARAGAGPAPRRTGRTGGGPGRRGVPGVRVGVGHRPPRPRRVRATFRGGSLPRMQRSTSFRARTSMPWRTGCARRSPARRW